jgi:DNA-binding NtrC family response regulator
MSEPRLLNGKKVLIVDDEPDILEVLTELLPMCDVSAASNFADAKRMLESRQFDIAILDIMGVDGFLLLEIANRRNTTAVMLTAHALTPASLRRSIQEGAAFYIPKDEMTNIATFLNDVLEARKKGRNTWSRWEERLPSSYFERRFGAAWQDADKEFWATFRAGLKKKRKKD